MTSMNTICICDTTGTKHRFQKTSCCCKTRRMRWIIVNGTHAETYRKKTHTHIHTSSASHQLSVLTQADEVPDNKASSSSQPNAAHPAALPKAQQKVVDEIRTFGRLPKKNMGDSAEDKFVQDKADALDNCNLQLCLMLCYCQWNTC